MFTDSTLSTLVAQHEQRDSNASTRMEFSAEPTVYGDGRRENERHLVGDGLTVIHLRAITYTGRFVGGWKGLSASLEKRPPKYLFRLLLRARVATLVFGSRACGVVRDHRGGSV